MAIPHPARAADLHPPQSASRQSPSSVRRSPALAPPQIAKRESPPGHRRSPDLHPPPKARRGNHRRPSADHQLFLHLRARSGIHRQPRVLYPLSRHPKSRRGNPLHASIQHLAPVAFLLRMVYPDIEAWRARAGRVVCVPAAQDSESRDASIRAATMVPPRLCAHPSSLAAGQTRKRLVGEAGQSPATRD